MNKKKIPDAYCGLYCAACPDYRDELCYGCKSENVKPGWCETCNLKQCARGKGVEFCYKCDKYPCIELENFKTDKRCPYHTEVYDYLETIKTKGYNVWISEMKERWSCPECKTIFFWWDTVCPECGTKVSGYEKPGSKK